MTLGPICYTWIGNKTSDEIRSNCLRLSNERRTIANTLRPVKTTPQDCHYQHNCQQQRPGTICQQQMPCSYCKSIVSKEMLRHLNNCPVFLQIWDEQQCYHEIKGAAATTTRNNHSCYDYGNNRSCVEIVGWYMEGHPSMIRHLCVNQCYLHSFAPRREWRAIRQKIETFTSIGTLLDKFTCRLVYKDSSSCSNCDIVVIKEEKDEHEREKSKNNVVVDEINSLQLSQKKNFIFAKDYNAIT